MFETSTLTDVGVQYYTFRIVDKWRKEKIETITYKTLDRNDAILEHCTPSKGFYASSKACSVCRYKYEELKLSVRKWGCPQ